MKGVFYAMMKEYFPDLPLLLAKASPLLGTVLFTELFKKYVFADFNFLWFLAVVIVLDTLSKVYWLLINKQKL